MFHVINWRYFLIKYFNSDDGVFEAHSSLPTCWHSLAPIVNPLLLWLIFALLAFNMLEVQDFAQLHGKWGLNVWLNGSCCLVTWEYSNSTSGKGNYCRVWWWRLSEMKINQHICVAVGSLPMQICSLIKPFWWNRGRTSQNLKDSLTSPRNPSFSSLEAFMYPRHSPRLQESSCKTLSLSPIRVHTFATGRKNVNWVAKESIQGKSEIL